MLRLCSKCKVWKPSVEFHNSSTEASGKVSRCKPCISAYQAGRYQVKRDEILGRVRAYTIANKQMVSDRQRRYRKLNLSSLKAAGRERVRAWKQTNPHRHAHHQHVRRSRIYSNGPICSVEEYEKFAKAMTRCVTCGSSNDLTVDHIIPLSKGGPHIVSNFQCLCASCNSSKGGK